MLLAAAVVAIILSYAKQASLFAFIIIGVLGGLFGVREVINKDVMTAFVDIGITLLLFMAVRKRMEPKFQQVKSNVNNLKPCSTS